MLKVLNENQQNKLAGNDAEVKIVVFTVSQQSILSLAHKYNSSNVEEIAQLLTAYLKRLGADLVLNTKIADDLALFEARNEFVERYKSEVLDNVETGAKGGSAIPTLPMLSSSCPGWVCYAEKTHGSFILPYISTTRSPQQIMGVLVKQFLTQRLAVGADRIYHVTVMPCYDKKLEASREDFFSEAANSRDVDCVITSSSYPASAYSVVRLKSFTEFSSFLSQLKSNKCLPIRMPVCWMKSQHKWIGPGAPRNRHHRYGPMNIPDREVIPITSSNMLPKSYSTKRYPR